MQSSSAAHGSQFEDCYRLAVMLDDLDPGHGTMPAHLLFDFKDIRWSSSQLKEHLRDRYVGIVGQRTRDYSGKLRH